MSEDTFEITKKSLENSLSKKEFYDLIERHALNAYNSCEKNNYSFSYNKDKAKNLFEKFQEKYLFFKNKGYNEKAYLFAEQTLTQEEIFFLTKTAEILNIKYEQMCIENSKDFNFEKKVFSSFELYEQFLIDNFRNQPPCDFDIKIPLTYLVHKTLEQEQSIYSFKQLKKMVKKNLIPHNEYAIIVDINKIKIVKEIINNFEKNCNKLSQFVPFATAIVQADNKISSNEHHLISTIAEKLNKQFELKYYLYFDENNNDLEKEIYNKFDIAERKLIELFRNQPYIDFRIKNKLIYTIRKTKEQHDKIIFSFNGQYKKNNDSSLYEKAELIHNKFFENLPDNFNIDDIKNADKSISEEEKNFLTSFAEKLNDKLQKNIDENNFNLELNNKIKQLSVFEQNLINLFRKQPIATKYNIESGKVFLIRKSKCHMEKILIEKKQEEPKYTKEEIVSKAKEICKKFEKNFSLLSIYIGNKVALKQTQEQISEKDKTLITKAAKILNIEFEKKCKEMIMISIEKNIPIPTNIDIDTKVMAKFDKYEQLLINNFRQEPPSETQETTCINSLINKSISQHLEIKSIDKLKKESIK